MQSYQDCYRLNNGVSIPCLGFGTYNDKDGDNLAILRTAMEAGYRYFDTASRYETERALGQAMRESGIPRGDFFIASKLWTDEMGYEGAKAAFERSLSRLGTDYLDLYLIHWPRRAEGDTDWRQLDIETWKAMEELYDAGRIKAIGVSNFLPHHLENLLANSRVKPAVDQLEIHPGYSQEAAVAYCLAHDIRPQAWSPLGRAKTLLTHPVLEEMAARYGKTVPQICLRFLVQKGIIPLPKSSAMERMKQNQDVFDFALTEEDLWMLSCMPQDRWLGEHPDYKIPKKPTNFDQ